MKGDEQEQRVMPGQTVSSLTDTALYNLSRHAGQSGYGSRYYQHETNMRNQVQHEVSTGNSGSVSWGLCTDISKPYLNQCKLS